MIAGADPVMSEGESRDSSCSTEQRACGREGFGAHRGPDLLRRSKRRIWLFLTKTTVLAAGPASFPARGTGRFVIEPGRHHLRDRSPTAGPAQQWLGGAPGPPLLPRCGWGSVQVGEGNHRPPGGERESRGRRVVVRNCRTEETDGQTNWEMFPLLFRLPAGGFGSPENFFPHQVEAVRRATAGRGDVSPGAGTRAPPAGRRSTRRPRSGKSIRGCGSPRWTPPRHKVSGGSAWPDEGERHALRICDALGSRRRRKAAPEGTSACRTSARKGSWLTSGGREDRRAQWSRLQVAQGYAFRRRRH